MFDRTTLYGTDYCVAFLAPIIAAKGRYRGDPAAQPRSSRCVKNPVVYEIFAAAPLFKQLVLE